MAREIMSDAERDFRELAKREPSNIVAVTYYGHSLFEQQKYAQAILPYEKARELEKSGAKSFRDRTPHPHRSVGDGLWHQRIK